jgi:hypothetical protein
MLILHLVFLALVSNSSVEPIAQFPWSENIDPERLTITDETILGFRHEDEQVYEISLHTGEQVRVYSPDPEESGRKVAMVGFIRMLDLVVVLHTNSNGKDFRINLHDRDSGEHLGPAEIRSHQGEVIDPYFHQVIESGHKIFFNLAYNRNVTNISEAQLQMGDPYAFVLGKTSYKLLRPESSALNSYARHWIIENQYQVQVIGQTDPIRSIYHFNRGKRTIREQESNKLTLTNWRSNFANQPDVVDENWTRWFSSFSKIEGYSKLSDDQILIAYTSPNPNHHYFDPNKEKSRTQQFLLNLQKINYKGDKVGRLESIPGGFFLGRQAAGTWILYPSENGDYTIGLVQ